MTAEIYVKEPGGQEVGKTNTALLLDEDGKFIAFGSKALNTYFEDNHNATDLLFERYKLGLDSSQGNSIATHATALNGKMSSMLFESKFICKCFS